MARASALFVTSARNLVPSLLLAGSLGAQLLDQLPKAHLPPDPFGAWAVAAGDADGDGDVDLFLGDTHRGVRMLRNDGAGRFLVASGSVPATSGYVYALALGDVDRDGDADLVVGNYSFGFHSVPTSLFLNDGRGVFTDVTASRFPTFHARTNAVLLVDVDGDGDLDI